MASPQNAALATQAANIPAQNAAYETLATRRSLSPVALVAPGPQGEDLERLLRLAVRVPDHGKLTPWRLVLIAGAAKTRWLARLEALAAQRLDAPKARASAAKMGPPPLVVAVISSPTLEHKIPEWEQRLSAGAVAMNLLNAAHALGYGGNWITGWHAYDDNAAQMLNLSPHEKVAGFVLLGNVLEPAPDRERPRLEDVVSWLEV